MRISRILRAILYKEWLELRQQRSLLGGMALFPLLFTIMPIALLYFMGTAPQSQLTNMNQMSMMLSADPAFKEMTNREIVQAMIGKQFALLFLLVPLFIPTVIAAYSVIGEKTQHTLEPLLATPIRIWELLLAKSLAALIPALVISYIFGTIFAIGMGVITISPPVFQAIISPGWLIIFLLCTPLMALIGVTTTVAISSRVNDPRTAQQLSGVVVIPLLLLFFAQLLGVLVLSPGVALIIAAVLAVIAALFIWIATRLFQREVILTRWS
jgi:ABC-2 type transport system permease protein